MKIALIGASGFVGSAILNEALERGHEVTAIVRNPEKITVQNTNLKAEKGDVFKKSEIAGLVKGSDIVISAYNPGWHSENIAQEIIEGSKAIQAEVKEAGVKRFITIGGAGSLEIAPGVQLVDTPEFPKEYKVAASAVRDYLADIKEEQDLDWTFFSPAIEMHQGISIGKTGKYRTGLDNPVFNENNRSILSVEDLAVAILDEAENPKHIKQRFTAAY
ncbi:NAD(P)H-binding protein [Pedobacter sp. HMF7647]|uniref:NAD(P)H-binding protein n=1 Tax=Hufsiella arboris TaxID=2695275 RepID=A0A7K1YDC4_9SPHI|nr:NAD(P)-dependent oxidoreductase [Hufsiella arboris]MXV52585.1 NAD(P)H-binding protein [Hufsiella arboris]